RQRYTPQARKIETTKNITATLFESRAPLWRLGGGTDEYRAYSTYDETQACHPPDEAGGIAAATIQCIYTVRPLRQRLRVLRMERVREHASSTGVGGYQKRYYSGSH